MSTSYAMDVTVQWDASGESDLDHYVVHWGDSSGTYTSMSISIDKDTTSYIITGLTGGQAYFFAVKAVDNAGLASSYSSEAAIPQINSPQNNFYINAGNYTSYTISGTAAAAASVEILAGASSLGTTTADGTGSWELSADFSTTGEGTVSLTATSTGATSSAVTGILDKTAPLSPSITTDGDNGAGNDYSTTGSTVTLGGTCSSDTTAIHVNGSATGVTYTAGETSWTYTGSMQPGDNTFSVIAYDTAGNVSSADSITVTSQRPYKPGLLSPTDGGTGVSLTVELQSGAFSHPGGTAYTHGQSQWQISADSDFSSLLLDITSASHLLSLRVPHAILDEGTAYYWRVRFYDNNLALSDWSDPNVFTTIATTIDQDSNGVPDDQDVDSTVDLDGNGTPDINQSNIKCVNTVVGNGIIGISIDDSDTVATIESLQSIDPDTISDTTGKPESIPLGLIAFKITVDAPGDAAQVTVYFSGSTQAAEEDLVDYLGVASWYKYDFIDGWQDYSDHATFDVEERNVILQLTDGGFGDADGVANGIIVDPSGLGFTSIPDNGGDGGGGGGGGGCFIDSIVF